MNEKQAIKAILKGNQKGFEFLYKHYERQIYNYLKFNKNLNESDAEEVLQDVFIKFFKTISENKWKQDCSALTWLYVIAKTVACDYWRKENRRENTIISGNHDTDEWVSSFYNELATKEFEEEMKYLEIQKCLELVFQLLEKQAYKNNKLLDCLKNLTSQAQGTSTKEISEAINKSPDATRQYLKVCRKRLKEYQPIQECWKGLFK